LIYYPNWVFYYPNWVFYYANWVFYFANWVFISPTGFFISPTGFLFPQLGFLLFTTPTGFLVLILAALRFTTSLQVLKATESNFSSCFTFSSIVAFCSCNFLTLSQLILNSFSIPPIRLSPSSQYCRNKQTTTNEPTTLQSTMVALRFSKEEFVHLGLRMASNWSEQTIENSSYKINKERLKDFYYASPRTLFSHRW
jgi:hypothetical protein